MRRTSSLPVASFFGVGFALAAELGCAKPPAPPPVSPAVAPSSLRARGEMSPLEQELLSLTHAERTARGLPPLEPYPGLAAVARAHSQDMSVHGFLGHISPTTGTPAERLERAGLKSGLVQENVGRGYSARQLHDAFMQSPGHRANLLSVDVTHMGTGIVGVPDGPHTALYATELFVRMPQRIDVAKAPRRMLSLLNDSRRARGSPDLVPDANLTEAAARAARDYFAHPDQQETEVVDQATESLQRFSIAFERVGGVMAVVDRLEDAARLEPALQPSIRAVGIGVAQGSRPDVPPNSIAVVILLGWPR